MDPFLLYHNIFQMSSNIFAFLQMYRDFDLKIADVWLSAKEDLGNRHDMQRLQDDFYKQVRTQFNPEHGSTDSSITCWEVEHPLYPQKFPIGSLIWKPVLENFVDTIVFWICCGTLPLCNSKHRIDLDARNLRRHYWFSRILPQINSDSKRIFRYDEAFYRLSSHAGSHDGFPRVVYTNPQDLTNACVNTRKMSNRNASANIIINSYTYMF